MLGLFGTLDMAKRSMDTSRQGIELTGHNLSNVSNPAYARQRLQVQTNDTVSSAFGPVGTGSKVVGIQQLRDALLDSQIVTEGGVTGYLDAKQKALESAQIDLGEQIDRQSSNPASATAAQGIAGQNGIAEQLTAFFNSLQALSTSTNETADRQVTALTAQSMTQQFNTVRSRLTGLQADLNTQVSDDVTTANQLLQNIADLSKSISSSEAGGFGSANDLRDRRQEKVEALSQIFNIQTSESPTTKFNLTLGGQTLISDNTIQDTIATAQDANGNLTVQTATGGIAFTPTSGSVQGEIDARDGEVQTLVNDLDSVAGTLITQVNSIHSAGFAQDGVTTGAAFFTGTNAADIAVNPDLISDPGKIQASADGNPGNNDVAVAMARLGQTSQTDLANLTFNGKLNQTVATFGQTLADVQNQGTDQQAVTNMLSQQRDSVGGVSIDEEVTNLLIFQRAYQASAKMISTVDQLLQSVIAMKA